jgi:cation diffusion facilitator CzcD-associated flavoprotein CzcO
MKVAIIGSGATAVTLAPALAEQGGKVTIVQRSPTYVVARPGRSVVARLLQEALPARAAGATIRWLNILLTIFMYGRARRKPDRVAKWIRDQARAQLPEGYPVDRDFTPDYKPWDQRLCLIPDGDLFAAMSADKVSIATGAIERFTPKGLRLVTAEEVEADIIVTATGLNVRFLGGIEVEIDGKRLSAPECLVYRGMMLSGVPNLFVAFGYTNASWTLRVDLTARSVCRLLNHMRRNGQDVCVPRQEGSIEPRPILELSSGYLTRALPTLPSQGDRQPWRVPQNYLRDLAAMSLGRIDQELELRSSGG